MKIEKIDEFNVRITRDTLVFEGNPVNGWVQTIGSRRCVTTPPRQAILNKEYEQWCKENGKK